MNQYTKVVMQFHAYAAKIQKEIDKRKAKEK